MPETAPWSTATAVPGLGEPNAPRSKSWNEPPPARKPVTVPAQLPATVHAMLDDGVPVIDTGMLIALNWAPFSALSEIVLVLGVLAPPAVAISYVPPPMPTNRSTPTF